MNNDLISRSDIKDHISELLIFYIGEFTKCPKCLYDEASGADLANAILNAIDNAPPVETNCENCPFKKFSEDLTDKLAKVMADNGITDFDEFAKQCGVSYLHQDSITTSDTKQ